MPKAERLSEKLTVGREAFHLGNFLARPASFQIQNGDWVIIAIMALVGVSTTAIGPCARYAWPKTMFYSTNKEA